MTNIDYSKIKPTQLHISTDVNGILTAWIWDKGNQVVVGKKKFTTKSEALNSYKANAHNVIDWLSNGLPTVKPAEFA